MAIVFLRLANKEITNYLTNSCACYKTYHSCCCLGKEKGTMTLQWKWWKESSHWDSFWNLSYSVAWLLHSLNSSTRNRKRECESSAEGFFGVQNVTTSTLQTSTTSQYLSLSRILDWIDEIFWRICRISYRQLWSIFLLAHFFQTNSLTVAFLTGWVKTFFFFVEKLELFIF